MNLQRRRWLFAPIRQWQTRRLMAQHGPSLTYTTAWALIALRTSPNEFTLVQQWARESGDFGEPGLYNDEWSELTDAERARRKRWLIRHGCSPVQRLGISEPLLKRAGIHVIDWGQPRAES
ncbi:hypothetical protein [Streptomyces sp. NPDC004232]|uniref:hypothetical protein n=1 Tax=unclassified Streptomyces TaxID=2593676 RepID=UPI0033BA191E